MTQKLSYNQASGLLPETKTDIFVGKQLGSGRFQVFHAYFPQTGKQYALKAFPKTEDAGFSYLQEKEIISNLNHKNIIKYVSDIKFKSLKEFESNLLLLEYAPYGSLFDLVINKGLIDEKMIRTYFHQLIDGMEYLHSKGIAHIDLKLDNLLLGDEFVLKIIDFDQSQKFEEKKLKCRGTAYYRAPEMLEDTCGDYRAADIYSLGVILFTCKAREFPFVEEDKNGKTNMIHYDLFTEHNEDFWKIKVADKKNDEFFSKSFKDLVNGMLEKEPKKRITLQDIKRSRWYKEPTFGKEELKEKMEKIWERIAFQKSLKKKSNSPTY
jgi:serine/threonine protein kinase